VGQLWWTWCLVMAQLDGFVGLGVHTDQNAVGAAGAGLRGSKTPAKLQIG
jgi:hypothetical protein